MKKFLFLTIMLLLISCQDVDDNKPLLTHSKKKQPVYIVNPNRHLNVAEFWISQLPEPDKVIMSEDKIKQFNNQIAYRKGTLNYFKDINREYNTKWIKEKLLKNFNGLREKVKYFPDNTRVSAGFFQNIKKVINLKALSGKKVTTRYALSVNYSDQKIIPTEESLLKKKNQIYFDRNQNSALDIATPIAILHSTADNAWHYGIGPTSSGWIRNSDIAFGKREDIQNYLDSKNFVVTTSAKTPLLFQGVYHDYFRMGIKIPYLLSVDNEIIVLVPTRNQKGELIFTNGTVKIDDVHIGYLSYTPRNILTQAFKFLHAPYGWGGMFGEQDCSKFIQETYATTGVRLPRNSASQSEVGEAKINLELFTKEARHEELQKWGIAGGSILHLKGHITLYLGEYKGEPFIIHTVWGASKKHFALGRTAVTSLNFNNYLGKIDKITNITQ